jgi:hypothetical protein
MWNDFTSWLVGVITSVSITGVIGYLWRDSFGRFMAKSVEHRFDKKLEEFKSEIKESEKEMEQMRGYLSAARSGRDSLLQAKKFESAENLIKIRKSLDEFNLAVFYMQMFKIDALFESVNDPKIQNLIDVIIKPLKIDEKIEEYRKLDQDTPRLYLSDKTMRVFDVYSDIIMVGVSKLRMLETKIESTSDIVTSDKVINRILELLPNAKDGFEKHGYSFMFQFHSHFRRELLIELKNELAGDNNMVRDTESAAELAMGLRSAKVRVQETIEQYNIPDALINTEVRIQ